VISWRYHVVSIVAVVLAFGLGILAGTAVVNDEFVRRLQENTDRAQRDRDAALAEVARYERFVAALQPTLRDDRLPGVEAVIVTLEGADGPARRAADELEAAGAEVLVSIALTTRFGDLETAQNADALGRVLDLPDAEPAELLDRAADALAVRFAVGPDGDTDVLAELLTAGFVTADRDLDEAALAAIGGVTQIDVIAAGDAEAADAVAPSDLVVPMIERLAALRDRVAVVGPTEDAYGLVGAIRDGSIPDCALVTVDDIDLGIGGIAFVMGLERLLADPDPTVRPGGDYGLEGDAIVPGPEPPASCRR
jgi:hypothetical protein